MNPIAMDPLEMLVRAAKEFPDQEERRVFLDWACRDNPDLRDRARTLLARQAEAEMFFDFNPFDCATPDIASDGQEEEDEVLDGADAEGLRIGCYRLVRRLGAGGHGVVYLADQEKPVRRKVALKLIRPGLDHAAITRRFEQERQSLAVMDHPGIARVLDAGSTVAGRLYFVMEWVVGRPISVFCDAHCLSVQARLELFIHVCHAVQHAHQKGVIHRDLKPSNILVSTHDGIHQPKVIDFGIAKAVSPDESEVAGETEAPIGTPDYMSPEQGLAAAAVDTRADLFSLGAVLNELLTGHSAFGGPAGGSRMTTGEVRRFLLDRDPMAPSRVLRALPPDELQAAAACRGCRPRELVAQVDGDLDVIVLKCLAHAPEDRYQTVHGLAADLRRHLGLLPVEASTGGTAYRVGKLIRRNRLVFSVGAIVFLSLSAGFGTSTWLFFRESDARREQARLRTEAEASRTVEAGLRAQAEAREASAQAAVKLSYGQIEEADQLLAAIPTDMAPSSLEAADAYRKVGDWHRQAGRIQQAAERFTALAGSISAVDRSDIHQVSGDLLPAAVSTCEVGDWKRYEQVRQVALERFGTTKNPIVAEQIIKACTLRPADPPTMAKIASLSAFLESSVNPGGGNDGKDDGSAWKCYSLALWNHRLGDPAQTIRWGELSLQRSMEAEPRVACVRLLLAMARHQLGETGEAGNLLAEAAQSIRARMDATTGKWADETSLWVDWMNAHILLKEAKMMIGAIKAD